MPRIKAKCECGAVVSLLFDQAEYDEIAGLKEGEYFEHKCPVCEAWAGFKVVE